jgi:hypothetical protein
LRIYITSRSEADLLYKPAAEFIQAHPGMFAAPAQQEGKIETCCQQAFY